MMNYKENVNQERLNKAKELVTQSKKYKKKMTLFKYLNIVCIISIICLIAFLVLRPQPSNIPDPFVSVSNFGEFGVSPSVSVPSDYMGYASDDVQAYWTQSRITIGIIVFAIIVFIYSSINKAVYKRRYKRVMAQISEMKKTIKNNQ